MIIDLTHLKPGETGTVTELRGGYEFTRKIQNMGVRPGKMITKLSSHFWRGPQTVQIDKAKIAIGFGMAKKVMIEVER